MQFALAAGVQLGGQLFQQRGQHPGIGGGFAVERRRHAVLGSQRLYRIAASGRIEQVRGQLAVKMQGFANMPLFQCQAVEGLRVKGPDFGIAVQQGGQAVGVWQVDFLSLYGVPAAVGVLGHKQAAFHQQRQGGRLYFFRRSSVHGGGSGAALLQTPAVHHLMHFQRGQQLGGCGGVTGLADIGGGVRLDGRVLADGAQHVGQVRLIAVGRKLGPLAGLDGLVLEVRVNIFQRAELRHQGQGGLFADARHTGDIIGRIAHQALDVDELRRLHTILFADGGGVHGNRLFVGGQQNGGVVVHQLQAVPVAGGQQGGAPGGLAGGGQGAQNIVGLPALAAYLHKAQVGQQFFQYGHLLGQLLGHAVAGGFVAVVGLVAERRGAQIPGDGHSIGLVGGQQVEQYILEAVNGVGIAAVLGRQQLDAEKRAVDQTVAVQYHQFHSVAPF